MSSVRQTVLENLKAAFEAAEVADDSTTTRFSEVNLGPIDITDHRKQSSVGLVADPETYDDLYPFLTRRLPVKIEIRITANRGDKPALIAEQYLAAAEKTVLEDQSRGGVALDTQLVSNEVDLDTHQDKAVLVLLQIAITYRHSSLDPYDPAPYSGT